MPPSYRERLRVEGLALAGSAFLATLVLLLAASGATDALPRTLIVFLVAFLLIAWLGPRSVHVAVRRASQLFTPDLGDGEPRALWQLPVVVAIGTVIVTKLAGATMGFRLTLVLIVLGLFQAFVLERIVAVHEGQSRRRYFRVEGTKMFGATHLGYVQRRVR